jgi:hypothetical protein
LDFQGSLGLIGDARLRAGADGSADTAGVARIAGTVGIASLASLATLALAAFAARNAFAALVALTALVGLANIGSIVISPVPKDKFDAGAVLMVGDVFKPRSGFGGGIEFLDGAEYLIVVEFVVEAGGSSSSIKVASEFQPSSV